MKPILKDPEDAFADSPLIGYQKGVAYQVSSTIGLLLGVDESSFGLLLVEHYTLFMLVITKVTVTMAKENSFLAVKVKAVWVKANFAEKLKTYGAHY